MSAAKIQYFENIENQAHREFINSQCNCVLCGTALELQHIVLDQDDKIQEEAFCAHCQVKTRAKIFTLL